LTHAPFACHDYLMADNYDQLKNALQSYVGQITNAVILARAQVTLDNYIEAERAYGNITKSAAASYSDARGSVTKRAIDDARENRDALYSELVDLIREGGVTFDGGGNSVALWDLSGDTYA